MATDNNKMQTELDILGSNNNSPIAVEKQGLMDKDDSDEFPFEGSPVRSVGRRNSDLKMGQDESGGIGTMRTVFLIFRSLVGIGVLAFPLATQMFGIASTIIFLPLFSIIILYVLDLVFLIANDLKFTGSNIDDLIVASGNEKWVRIFSTINNWMNLSSAIANCIFAGMFLDWASCNYGVTTFCNNRITSNLLGICLSLPLTLFPKMKYFAIPSMIAACLFLITIFSILGWFGHRISKNGKSTTTKFFDLSGLGTFFGVACFAIEGIGLIFPIRNSMRRQKDFRIVFHLTSFGVILMYLIFGVFGAYALGNKLPEIVLFYFNKNNLVFYYLGFAYSIGIFISFPFFMIPITHSLMESYFARRLLGPDAGKEECMNALVRALICVMCFLLAMTGINILSFISVAGSILNSITAFLFPILFYLNYFGSKGEITPTKKYFLLFTAALTTALSALCLFETFLPMFTGGNSKI